MAMDGLVARVRDRIRAKHYSFQTEKAYLQWVSRYVEYHDFRHPQELTAKDVEQFLTMLATKRRVSASTQNQALAAILFLYKEVLGIKAAWVTTVVRAKRPKHLPVVLTHAEVERVLSKFQGTNRVIASLLYGSGLRVTEGLQLRVKDIDIEYRQIVVRDGKGQKDRITILPDSLHRVLVEHLKRVRALHDEDREKTSSGRLAAFRTAHQASQCRGFLGLVLRIPCPGILPRSIFKRAGPTSRSSKTHAACDATGGYRRWNSQARDLSHLSPLLCHSLA
jgi:site-specific recombinase XerD